MPLFVWAALAIAALLVSGSAAANLGAGRAIIVQPSVAASAAEHAAFPWYFWLVLGVIAAVAVWLGIRILWSRR